MLQIVAHFCRLGIGHKQNAIQIGEDIRILRLITNALILSQDRQSGELN